ncbi:Small integral membrane protein 20 [Takifugu flavidus]|uniref:Small integral membrane protein 20 n=1 Tax=Takifugu flavidus TaxID=433684 RepID=A0A5C6NBK0_9TELE|nr:Small integral membrane protein 20 [Takifugu flavidus]
MSKNTRIALIFGGFVTAVAAAFYPIFFYPYMHKREYREVQKMNRDGINQADVQPVDSSSDSSLGRASEVSSERGNSREPREEESRILERTRHLHTHNGDAGPPECNRLLSAAFRWLALLRDAAFTPRGSFVQTQASRLTQAVVYRPLRDARRCEPFNAVGAGN